MSAATRATAHPRPTSRSRRSVLTYAVIVLLPSLGAVALLVFGLPAGRNAPGGRPPIDRTAQLLVSIVVVLLAGRAFGRLAQRVGQPPVVGEIFAGLCLGPSVLGQAAPALSEWLFAPDLRPVLDGFAQVGVVALMFVVGREVGRMPLRGQGKLALTVAHASIAGPFLGGVLLAIPLYRDWAGPGSSPLVFALFLGSALAITAFPVLARILDERGMINGAVGRLSLLSAAVADVAAWCLVATVTATAGRGSAVLTVALTIGFGVLMVTWGRRTLARLLAGRHAATGLVLTGLMLSAAATTTIGIHPIFGAFLFGMVCPATPVVERTAERLSGTAGAVLLPFFFVGTGLRVDIWRVGPDLGLLVVTLLVLLIAMLGKTAGPYAVARSAAVNRPDALRLAVLLNTRGLTELVLLNLGLSLGLLSDRMFVVLILMALVTTASTAPLLSLLDRRYRRPAERAPVDQSPVDQSPADRARPMGRASDPRRKPFRPGRRGQRADRGG